MSNFGNIPFPGIENAALCSDYVFYSASKVVICNKDISRFLLIVNGTDGLTIFNPFNPATTGVVIGNEITLTFDTTSMSDTDDLYIYVERDNEDEFHRMIHALEDSADHTESMKYQLILLNERFEAAFETGIAEPDEEKV